jgi:hypothetical protein
MLTLMLMRLLRIIMLTVIAAYVLPSEKGEASSQTRQGQQNLLPAHPAPGLGWCCPELRELG